LKKVCFSSFPLLGDAICSVHRPLRHRLLFDGTGNFAFFSRSFFFHCPRCSCLPPGPQAGSFSSNGSLKVARYALFPLALVNPFFFFFRIVFPLPHRGLSPEKWIDLLVSREGFPSHLYVIVAEKAAGRPSMPRRKGLQDERTLFFKTSTPRWLTSPSSRLLFSSSSGFRCLFW